MEPKVCGFLDQLTPGFPKSGDQTHFDPLFYWRLGSENMHFQMKSSNLLKYRADYYNPPKHILNIQENFVIIMQNKFLMLP